VLITPYRNDNCYFWAFKDFDQHRDEVPKAKLAGMTGQLSTRMGAAIRHAGRSSKNPPLYRARIFRIG
jgi:nitric oxide reductase activation protein